jgi:glycosyltransferase involved in cell wall biosynthesis
MSSLGHRVYLYASEDNEARCDELITIITKKEQYGLLGMVGPDKLDRIIWTPDHRSWKHLNKKLVPEIGKRISPRDFICLITGTPHKTIKDHFQSHMVVEFGVGYEGVMSNFLVFESYAWMHTIYCQMFDGKAFCCKGRFYDEVIPNYFETELFPYSETTQDYFPYLGRLTDMKGILYISNLCKKAGVKLKVAGNQGEFPYTENMEYLGLVGIKERGELLSKARAVLCPTIYVEPFCGVSVESLFCGTPVICTDWGAFTENIQNGVDGFRCRIPAEFLWAMQEVEKLNPRIIRDRAIRRFSTDVIRYRYQDYFDRLYRLWDFNKILYDDVYDPTNKHIKGKFLWYDYQLEDEISFEVRRLQAAE